MTHARSIPLLVSLVSSLSLALIGCGSPGTETDGAGGAAGHTSSGAGGTTGAAGMSGPAGAPGLGGSPGAGGSTGLGGSPGPAGRGGGSAGAAAGSAGTGVAGEPGAGGSGAAGSHGGTSGAAAGSGGGMAAGGRNGGSGGGAAGAPGGSGGSGMTSSTSAGCGKTPTIPSSMYNNGQTIAITAANMQRRFILNVPTNYDNTKPYKLIIAFHQLDGNDKQMYANGYYHLLNLSGNSAIFVAPNGQKNGSPCTTTGNGDGGCGWPNSNNSDIALADAVVAQIKDNFCVDTNRIFATGWSYGGSMSYKTACERPLGTANGFIRAVAVYSGAQLSGNCTPSKPVAYYASHGTSDSVLNYDGGVKLAQNFATADSCTWATPTKVTSGNHVCTNIAGCMTGYPVRFCSFNGDHTPDPRDSGQSSSWQYQVVWDWFNSF
jgi:poly(3-hydroxybutyrate) depolymerase